PPQHCTPCRAGARSDRLVTVVSSSRAPEASRSRAWSTADCSRLPPPIVPQHRRSLTTIFAPASRGACPRTVNTVTSTPGWRARRLADRLRPVHRAVLRGPLEQRDPEIGRHLREAGQLVRAGRLRGEAAAGIPVGRVPPQVLQREPARALHEPALDLAEVDQ